jgi:hypothetical protein
VFARAFPGRDVLDTDTFVGLGGDSLCFAEVSIALGDVLGQLPDHWQNLTIADLEGARSRRSWLQPVDTALLLRFVCIVEIVTGHFTWWPVAGGTFALVAVAGYNFSRFQLPNVLATGSVRSILYTAARIAIPTVVVIAAIQCRHLDLDLAQVALVSNWHDAAAQELDFWFVEMITQLLLILAALLCLPAVRRYAAHGTTRFTVLLLVTGAALALLTPLAWSSAHLYDRVPHMLFWLFMLGWFIQQATTPARKTAAAALLLVLPLLVWGREIPLWIGHGREWVWGAALLLLFTTKIRVPYPINRLACWIGGASMFIYITHWSVRQVWHRITPIENEFIDVAVAIAAGVVAWWVWEQGARALIKAVRAWRGAPAEQAQGQMSGLEETGTFHVRGPR